MVDKAIGTGNEAENTGGSASLGNKSGAKNNENSRQIVSYRGEENLWGNIWTWVDGANEQNPSEWTSTSGSLDKYGTLFVADHEYNMTQYTKDEYDYDAVQEIVNKSI